MTTFESLSLKKLKEIVKFYKQHINIVVSKKTKSQIIADMNEHLEIVGSHVRLKSNVSVIDTLTPRVERYARQRVGRKGAKVAPIVAPVAAPIAAPVAAPKVAPKAAPVKGGLIPPISPNDRFFVWDEERSSDKVENLEGLKYSFKDVKCTNDLTLLFPDLSWQMFMPWNFFQKPEGLKDYMKYIKKLTKEYNKDEKTEEVEFLSQRLVGAGQTINIFISNKKTLVGLMRVTIRNGDLHWFYVYVNQEFQGSGYASEEIDLLFAYLKKNNLMKKFIKVSLKYKADTPRGWIAYDNGIKKQGFICETIEKAKTNNNIIEGKPATDEQIRGVHLSCLNKGELVWNKVRSGAGMKGGFLMADKYDTY